MRIGAEQTAQAGLGKVKKLTSQVAHKFQKPVDSFKRRYTTTTETGERRVNKKKVLKEGMMATALAYLAWITPGIYKTHRAEAAKNAQEAAQMSLDDVFR